MIKKMVICLNYRHFENKLRSVIVSENHYLNQILDVHPLRTLVPLPPGGPSSVPSPMLLTNNDSYRQNSALHIFTFDLDCF